MSNVHEFHPRIVGDGRKVSVDDVLAGAKAAGLTSVVVVGFGADEPLYVAATDGQGETLVLLERAKRLVVFGEST